MTLWQVIRFCEIADADHNLYLTDGEAYAGAIPHDVTEEECREASIVVLDGFNGSRRKQWKALKLMKKRIKLIGPDQYMGALQSAVIGNVGREYQSADSICKRDLKSIDEKVAKKQAELAEKNRRLGIRPKKQLMVRALSQLDARDYLVMMKAPLELSLTYLINRNRVLAQQEAIAEMKKGMT